MAWTAIATGLHANDSQLVPVLVGHVVAHRQQADAMSDEGADARVLLTVWSAASGRRRDRQR
jgi:hypothetical protein